MRRIPAGNRTGAEVLALVVSQMRKLWKDENVIGFYSIEMGNIDFAAWQTHFEDIGSLPVFRRRNLIGSTAGHFDTPIHIKDQAERPWPVVEPVYRYDFEPSEKPKENTNGTA